MSTQNDKLWDGSLETIGAIVTPIGDEWVSTGTYVLPRRFVAQVGRRVQPDDTALALTIEVEIDSNGRAQCRELTLRGLDRVIDAETLRRFPLRKVLSFVTTAALVRVRTDGKKAWTEAPSVDEHSEFYDSFSRLREPRSGSPVTDDQLRKLADAYREAVSFGKPPVKTIMQAKYATRSTVSRWVAEARKRGFLDPSSRNRQEEK